MENGDAGHPPNFEGKYFLPRATDAFIATIRLALSFVGEGVLRFAYDWPGTTTFLTRTFGAIRLAIGLLHATFATP